MVLRRLCVIAGLVALVSCGGGSGSPTSPSASMAQVAGVWRATSRITSISTAECIGQTLAAGGVGGVLSNSTIQLTQSASSVSAIVTDTDSGATSRYTGSVGSNTMALNWQSCDLCAFRNLRCSNGSLRDITPQADSITATVSGGSATGTEAITYNVTVAGTGLAAGILTMNASFSATRQ